MNDVTHELIDVQYHYPEAPSTVYTIQVAAVICGSIGIHHPDEVTGKPEIADGWLLTHIPSGRALLQHPRGRRAIIEPVATMEELLALAWRYDKLLKDWPDVPADIKELAHDLLVAWMEYYERNVTSNEQA